MATKLKGLLFEAYRRNDIADTHEKSKPLSQRWLGLGTEAAYRPAIQAGLMQWHDGRTPPPRCSGWLVLTEAGITAMTDHAEEFSRCLSRLKQDSDYQRSYRASFMLAGGISTY